MLQGFIPHKTALLCIFELLHKRNEKQRNCVGSSSFEELGAKRFEGRSREAIDVRGRERYRDKEVQGRVEVQ